MKISERFTPRAVEVMREAIREASGNEVLFVGTLNGEGLVAAVTVAARGNESAAPAVAAHMAKGEVIIHNHPSGQLTPSSADIQVASRLGEDGIGFYIIDNTVARLHVVSEAVRGAPARKIDPAALARILEPGGNLSRQFAAFEPRESQVGMLRMTAAAFNDDVICVAEAGTGVGKSFAYLLPALAWVMRNDERVVISTATINLQHQLFDKDIPFVKRLLGCREKVVLVKGRGNYLCRSRLQEALEDMSLFEDERRDLLAIAEWAKTTNTGCRSDLSFYPSDLLWSSVCSEADACLGLKCAYRESCFVLRAKREAASARILVANHHLLFSDLAMRSSGAGYEATAVLPPFQRIVFDEAHNLENSATSFFSEVYNRFTLFKALSRLFRRKRGRNYGLLISLQTIVLNRDRLAELPAVIERIREQADVVDAVSSQLLSGSSTYRFLPENGDPSQGLLLESLKELQMRIISLMEVLEEELEALPEELQEQMPVYETRMVLRRLQGVAGICEQFNNHEEKPEKVFWLERRRTSQGDFFCQCTISPIDIAPIMQESVFEPYRTVVCTSATLTVNGRFSFWKSRLGLHAFPVKEVRDRVFPSPFRYKEQVLLGIPTDAPLPDDPAYESFLTSFVGEVLEISGGSGLILFTSYDMLRRIYSAVKPRLNAAGITTLKQGDDDRSRLLTEFNEDTASVLFATESFWEGVDTPGDALRVVILCRLPFRVPSDPVVKARVEAIQKRNGNPFFELSLPEAIMKLKQGFGRLMRRHSDRGIVLIPDTRVVRKAYGHQFLRSLPETRRSAKASASLLADIRTFLAS